MVCDVPRCPLCGSGDVRTYFSSEDQRLSHSALGSSRKEISPGRILRCQVCLFGFRQMRPSEMELSKLYRDLDIEVYEFESHGRERTALRHLSIVQRYCSPGRLLDVGCASGVFLRCAAEGGWKVVGVEPAQALYVKARQVLAGRGEVICGTLQEVRLPLAFFDAVTLWDVLEHVPDPLRFFSLCASLLRPGGYLFLNVPDLDSPQSRLMRGRWPLLLPEHLNYFNRESLRLCIERAHLAWVYFGRRSVSFSIDYVLYRLAQHGIPGALIGRELARHIGLGRTLISVPLGELYGVSRCGVEPTASREFPSGTGN